MSRILVLGGARSGKSVWAETSLAERPAVDYVAASPPRADDPEWVERIAAHRARRPAHWATIETSDVAGVLRAPGAATLIDCLGTWLAGACDRHGVWDEAPGSAEALARETGDLVDAWTSTSRHAVVVSNEVGQGVVPATRAGRRFRDDLGRLNIAFAAAADEVWWLVAGLASRLK